MTGFGKSNFISDEIELEIEIKTVNQRFFEFRLTAPRELYCLENRLKEKVGTVIKRGKVDMRINLRDKRIPEICLDEARLLALKDVYTKAARLLENGSAAEFILRDPSIIYVRESNFSDNSFLGLLDTCLTQALQKQQEMACEEGKGMRNYFIKSHALMQTAIRNIQDEFPRYKEEIYRKLKSHIEEITKNTLQDEDLHKILMETAFYVEKADITEEIVRFINHLEKFTIRLDDEEAGKALNFILQEMQREANTIGAKFNSSRAFPNILILKEEVEKCRELVQNAE